ncbi:hypothetical protein [Solilutibacter pythonis]|nr:hypothetical protein [Lysobacter pythonis]
MKTRAWKIWARAWHGIGAWRWPTLILLLLWAVFLQAELRR